MSTIGHNSGSSLEDLLNVDMLTAQMLVDHEAVFERRDELMAAFARFKAATESGITSDEQAGRANDFVAQLKRHAGAMEEKRVVVKQPFRAAVEAIDGLWKASGSDALTEMARAIERDFLTPYQRRKAEQERIAAQEEADRRRAQAERERKEAEAAMAAAERTLHPELLEQAATAETMASSLEAQALVAESRSRGTVTELSRVRGDHGSTSSLRETWDYEITDFALLDDRFKQANERALNAAIKVKHGLRDAPGLKIFPVYNSKVRK